MTTTLLNNRFVFVTFLIMAFFKAPSTVSAFEHPGGLHTRSQIELTYQKLATNQQPWTSEWSSLLNYASNRLSEQPSAVTDFHVPGYYKDQQGHINAKLTLLRDTEAAYSCALVYALNYNLSVNERNLYANKASELLNNWATVNKSFSGFDGQLAMSYTAVGMIHTAELIWNYPGWSDQNKNQFKHWASTVVYPAGDIKMRGMSNNPPNPNNWNYWGILLALSIDQLTENQTNLDTDITLLKELIDIAIETDGSMPRELGRGNQSISYTAFALEPLTAAIEITRNSGGPDLFTWNPPSGGTIKQALTFLFDRGLEKPSLWPIQSAVGHPNNAKRSQEIFEAMGRVYGINKWTNWANPSAPDLGTGIGWAVPSLIHLRPQGTNEVSFVLNSPLNLRY